MLTAAMVQAFDDARRRSSSGSVARVPPHNLEAEESLLGAMLLSRDAIVAAVEAQLGQDDFYKPAHGHVFEAITALYGQGEPADPVTVAEELRRAGLLEGIGGPATLISLQARTPAIGNATRYATIVEEYALLRRLIAVAGEIAEMGYSVPDDVLAAIDAAEALVFDVAQRRVTDSMLPIRELLERHLDHIEALYERGQDIIGVPTGYVDLDQQLAGLQPSNLVIVGGRPGTGKTSFSLGMAAHAALDGRHPVLVFSLEMSHLELTQRLLCSEARVDASRMRNGRLLETDWPKISHAVGRLAEAPIHIDDNPHLTVMEIRAKARRLKSRQGLGLIVIDYLQLMTGRQSAENRQVEVSEISRGLKILARELEVPVVALSQLSRNLETRADKRPVLADLRESGCVTADTRVLRADTGSEVTMGELFVSGERDIPVWTLDESLRMVPARMQRVFSTGIKPVFQLRLASGREVRATANHPFLTIEGWAQLDELNVGDRIAAPRVVPEPATVSTWPEAEVVMLAHLLGDGCFVARQPVHYTSADHANITAVEGAARHFGVTPRRVRQRTWWHVYLPSPHRVARGRRNPVAAWLDTLSLYGLHSWEKFIPRAVFGLSREQLALFVRHLWATDGSVGASDGRARLYYASTSRQLVEGLQQLLLRFEIQTRITIAAKAGHRPGFHLDIVGAENKRRFIDEIGVHGSRGMQAVAVRCQLSAVKKQPYCDSVPFQVWSQIMATASRTGLRRHALVERAGFAQSFTRTPPSRARLERVAEALDDDNLRRLATSHVLWDRVVAIEPKGEEVVFDATVDPTHNFVANGLTSSNSLEQDADVVIFLYRDELYNRDSPDRGTAEVIVAKHRNGPTGMTQLAFLENYTRFANMARGV